MAPDVQQYPGITITIQGYVHWHRSAPKCTEVLRHSAIVCIRNAHAQVQLTHNRVSNVFIAFKYILKSEYGFCFGLS